MLKAYELKMPQAVYGGEDAIGRLTDILRRAGAGRVALFTDRGIEGAGLLALVQEAVEAAGAEYYVLRDLPAEPTYSQVQALIDSFKAGGADMIVACGGGSVLDAAKLASVLVTDEYGVKELLDEPGRAQKCVPIILIPTTAGTGSEATPNAIVAVPEKQLKVGIVNTEMIADYVILDAVMIKKLPRKIAAASVTKSRWSMSSLSPSIGSVPSGFCQARSASAMAWTASSMPSGSRIPPRRASSTTSRKQRNTSLRLLCFSLFAYICTVTKMQGFQYFLYSTVCR